MQNWVSSLQSEKKRIGFMAGAALFMMLTWYAVTNRMEFLFGIPVAFIFMAMAAYNFRTLWLVNAFLVPASINLSGLVESASIRVPSDVLCIFLCLLTAFKILSQGNLRIHFGRHLIFIIIFFWLAWQMLVSLHSEMPEVSFKRVALFLWMTGGFYFLSVIIFRQKEFIFRYFWMIGACFALVMFTILMFYVSSGRNPFLMRFNPAPFFDDHTALGAFTSMLVPIFALFAFANPLPRSFKFTSKILLLIIVMGLFFSYSRGAWASAFFGLVLMAAIVYRRHLLTLAFPLVLVLGIGGYLAFQEYSGSELRNDSVSRKGYISHVASITNFKTDDSNAERINRWSCALEMYEQRPWTGFGPGTYMFVYGDFQKAKNNTLISTNHGDNGTAHNEFLLALSESGIPGALLTCLLFIVPIVMGIRGYLKSTNKQTAYLYLGAAMGVFTYGTHAVVNNFLDQDKVFSVFFGMLGIITALDTWHLNSEKKMKPKRNPQASPV